MTRIKKIATGILAAICALTVAGLTATAADEISTAAQITFPNEKVVFTWDYGSAQTTNIKNQSRYGEAYIDVKNATTGVRITSASKAKVLGYYGSAKAQLPADYSKVGYRYTSNMIIRSGSSSTSSVDRCNTINH